MGKRRIERTVDNLDEEILGDLTPDDRLKFTLVAEAQGKDRWVDRLRQTTPTQDYHGKDMAVMNRHRLAFIFAQQACYDLYTTWLNYQRLSTQQTQEVLAELFDLPSVSDHAPDDWRTDYEGRATEKLVELYLSYHTYDRFASTVLDVSLETWLTAMHHDAETILPVVEETINMEQATIDTINISIADTNAERDEESERQEAQHIESLEDVVAARTDSLCNDWNEILTPNKYTSTGPGEM